MTPYLVTFVLAVGSVGLWTLRVATTAQGSLGLSAGISMVEATTYIAVVSRLTGSLNAPLHMAVYAIGVGSGTYVGLKIDAIMRSRRSPVDLRSEPVSTSEPRFRRACHGQSVRNPRS